MCLCHPCNQARHEAEALAAEHIARTNELEAKLATLEGEGKQAVESELARVREEAAAHEAERQSQLQTVEDAESEKEAHIKALEEAEVATLNNLPWFDDLHLIFPCMHPVCVFLSLAPVRLQDMFFCALVMLRGLVSLHKTSMLAIDISALCVGKHRGLMPMA